MLKTQFFIAAALLSGVAIGFFVRPEGDALPHQEAQEPQTKALLADNGDAASLASLRARIADLERQLAERGETEVRTSQPDRDDARPEARPTQFASEMRERMAKMEKENPQRFAQMTNHFAQMRMRRRERTAMKMDFLSSVDTSGMNESARKTHEEFQDLIARRDELEERMHNPDLSDEERAELFGEMRENGRAMRRLNQAERDNLLAQTAEAVGLSGDDATELTETIKDIFEATEDSFGMRGGPPPGPPGPQPPVPQAGGSAK